MASADLARVLPVQTDAPAAPHLEAARFAQARQALPAALPGWLWEARASRRFITLCVASPARQTTPDMRAAVFFPLQREVVDYAPVAWRRSGGWQCLELRRFEAGAKLPARLVGVLVLPPAAPAARRVVVVDVPLKAEP